MDATRFRLNRLFAPRSGRCLTIAADHGFYGRPTLLTGVEDMGSVIDRLVELAPDALLLTPGQAPLLQRHTGRDRPALLLRVDITNVHGAAADDDLFADLVADPVGRLCSWTPPVWSSTSMTPAGASGCAATASRT